MVCIYLRGESSSAATLGALERFLLPMKSSDMLLEVVWLHGNNSYSEKEGKRLEGGGGGGVGIYIHANDISINLRFEPSQNIS